MSPFPCVSPAGRACSRGRGACPWFGRSFGAGHSGTLWPSAPAGPGPLSIPPMSCSARSIKVDRRVMALLSRSTGAATAATSPTSPVRAVTHVSVVKASPLLPPKTRESCPSPGNFPPAVPEPATPRRQTCRPSAALPCSPPSPQPPRPLSAKRPPGSGARLSPGGTPHPGPRFSPAPPAKKEPPSGSPFSSVLFRQEVLSWEGGSSYVPTPAGWAAIVPSTPGFAPRSPPPACPVHPEHRQGGGGQPVLHQGLRPALHHAEESFLLLVQVAAGAHPLPNRR